MLSRENYIFTTGYDGNTAIIDGNLKIKYSRFSTLELAQKGLYKAAICSAIYEGNESSLEQILKIYNDNTEYKISSISLLKRIFGISEVPKNILKTSVV